MKIKRYYGFTALFVLVCFVLRAYPVFADDTCVFSVTADDLPPNIVLLLDNGAEMEQIVWWFEKDDEGRIIKKFDNSINYTPKIDPELQVDVLDNLSSGNGFFNDAGYAIKYSGNKYYLVQIPNDLDVSKAPLLLVTDQDKSDIVNKKGTWTINGKTLTLPAIPSKVKVDGIIDNAKYFRYSKNYLNWLFFSSDSGSYEDVSDVDDGTDLPDVSRFYYAKKAIMTVAKGTGFKANFGIYYFANTSGGSQAQPLKSVVKVEENGLDDDGDGIPDDFDEILTSEFINNINNMITVTYSPLAEGLSTIGYYYSSPSSGASGGYCQSNFTIVISPGVSSEDQGTTSQHVPDSLSDYDGDGADGEIGEGKVMENTTLYTIPVPQNGSTYLDDVAYYLYSHDIVGDAPSTGSLCFDNLSGSFSVGSTVTGGSSGASGSVSAVNMDAGGTSGCLELSNLAGYFTDNENLTGGTAFATVNGTLYTEGEGFQNILTYTIGFMGDKEGDLFLINTSNNGNGHKNLYDTSDEEYGKYHFTADSPEALSEQLLAAVSDILSRTSTFMAPVVPVTRTTSGDKIYMAFFKPVNGNFWEGNVTKYGISSTNQIVDANGNAATWPNGAMKDSAVPYWATIDWAVNTPNTSRYIYTCLDGIHLTNFDESNTALTDTILGNPIRPKKDIINYVRGADVLDEDGDINTTENRSVITGDVLHSEPVIFQYRYADVPSETVVYFGANDGMLHAVFDEGTSSSGLSPGMEMWAFIPPDLLPRLKEMVEGFGHQDYVDSTPKIYFKDVDGDGFVDASDGDKVILICGERKGGTGYFALDVTHPSSPEFLWRINQIDDSATYGWAAPTTVIAELGETWSEPQFGKVKIGPDDTVGTPVFFVGGGYSTANSKGRTVLAVKVADGTVIKQFVTGSTSYMDYAIPSSVLVVDEDGNDFVDKVYVGDLGGQMWRIGRVTESDGVTTLVFPSCNEDITTWTARVFFKTDFYESRKFFYPPSVTLEIGYDMVFMGTGDRDNACCNNTTFLCSATKDPDIIAAVKETHSIDPIFAQEGLPGSFSARDLVDVTDPSAVPPNLAVTADMDNNGRSDQGWYIRLVDGSGGAVGEKVLAEGTVFYKTFYITTFTPNEDPCVPGGDGRLYALSYLTGAAVLDFDGDTTKDRSVIIGGGIPSKPVTLITKTGTKLLISVGSANPDDSSESFDAGVLSVDPLLPPKNFFYRFWREY